MNLKAFCSRFPTADKSKSRSAADGELFVNLGYAESALPYPRFQGRGQFDFSDEVGEREDVMLAAQAGCYSNLGERTIDQVAHPDQALVEHGTSGAGKAYVAGLEAASERVAVLSRFRSSWAKTPSRWFSASACACRRSSHADN